MAKSPKEAKRDGRRELAVRLLDVISDILGVENDSELAKWTGVAAASLSQWRNGAAAPQRTALKKILECLMSSWAEPIAEIEPVQPTPQGKAWRIDQDQGRRQSIRDRLEHRCGVYLFYDSMGRVTYVGQAKKNLFFEVEQRLAQVLRHGAYVRGASTPALKMTDFIQGDVVRFLSAYATMTGHAAHNIEAILIRAFANSHQNRKSAKIRFGQEWEA